MSKYTEETQALISLLGEENAERLKTAITDMLIENLKDSIAEYYFVPFSEWDCMMGDMLDACGKQICKKHKGDMADAMETAMLKVIESITHD